MVQSRFISSKNKFLHNSCLRALLSGLTHQIVLLFNSRIKDLYHTVQRWVSVSIISALAIVRDFSDVIDKFLTKIVVYFRYRSARVVGVRINLYQVGVVSATA